jgi:signal transduction histidine kinase
VTILVDNAIRHGPVGGTVSVAVRMDGREAVLTVDDDGPGIPAHERERVFDRFWRGSDARPGGTGLGLAIGAWIVTGHGGSIAAVERAGGGSRFVVRLPAAQPA